MGLRRGRRVATEISVKGVDTMSSLMKHPGGRISQARWHRLFPALALCGLLIGVAGAQEARPDAAGKPMLGGTGFTLDQLPESAFKRQAQILSPAARARLEAEIQAHPFPSHDLESRQIDADGMMYYVCRFPAQAEAEAQATTPRQHLPRNPARRRCPSVPSRTHSSGTASLAPAGSSLWISTAT